MTTAGSRMYAEYKTEPPGERRFYLALLTGVAADCTSPGIADNRSFRPGLCLAGTGYQPSER